MAQTLKALYVYARGQILKANLENSPQFFAPLVGKFATVREAWYEAASPVHPGAADGRSPPEASLSGPSSMTRHGEPVPIQRPPAWTALLIMADKLHADLSVDDARHLPSAG